MMQMCDVITTNKTKSIPLIFMIGQKQKYLSNLRKTTKLFGLKEKSLDGCYDKTYRLIITINSTSQAAYFIVQSIVMIIMHSIIVQSSFSIQK